VAEVCEETVPAGIVVEILDFDNLAANPERELSLWSPELREYWTKNHARWGSLSERLSLSGQRNDLIAF
jgi:hypothetical protein